MSLESRFEALLHDIEAWWTKHVEHPSVGSIAAAHLAEAKPELDKVVQKFWEPEPSPVVSVAPAVNTPPSE